MTIAVKDAYGDVQTVETLPAPGQAPAVDSSPVALSTEDKAALDAITAAIVTGGIGHGKKAVTTAGTAEAISSTTAAKWVIVQAYSANTGLIAVGGTGVDAGPTGTGIGLVAGQSTRIDVSNLAQVFVDATVSGEGVRFTYGT